MPALEIARFSVDPSRVEEMRARRTQAFEALQRQFQGMLSDQLVRLDEQTWMDLVTRESREAAEAAAREAPSIPEAAAYFETLDTILAMEHAEVVYSRPGQ